MNSPTILAHPDQPLVGHLMGVARRAEQFASHFRGEDHARLAGLLHDLGKAEKEFQKRIQKAVDPSKEDGKKQPHAHHGAALALLHELWPVAFAINGHHAGLHNRSHLQHVSLKLRPQALKECQEWIEGDEDWKHQEWPIQAFPKTLPAWLEDISSTTADERNVKMRAVEFYTRMLFSALVDADRLDTEESNRTCGSQANVLKRKAWRYGPKCLATDGAAEALLKMLKTAINERISSARSKNASQAVMDVRAEVLAACEDKASSDRGVFTLAVPTGGGKTLASVAFALHHIAHHNKDLATDDPRRLRRIIVVIPYLNIIQQTTNELMTVFGHTDAAPIILEHHSQAADPVIKKKEDADGWDKKRPLRQLAAENWDAPIIVTTSVQFFDSLFSRHPADARKLHNVSQSILIFDEVQSMPPLLLQPILEVLKELTSKERCYGSSLILCTATQPALGKSEDFEFGFERVMPIISPGVATEHFCRLKRVEYLGLVKDHAPPKLDNEALAAAMLVVPRKQALAIFNTRKQARALFQVLAEKCKDDESLRNSIFHLSTWMYPAHRLQVLAEVANRLNGKDPYKPCLLVSTQCVEAGVDVDFPEVWRAFGPYDSIVQAAGRCNRHGALADDSGSPILGQVRIFTPQDAAAPQGAYAAAMQNADLIRKMGKAMPDDPASFETYFRLFYQTTVPDPGGCAVQAAREKLHFEEVSEMFNFIDADSVPLLIESAQMSDGRTVEEWRKDTAAKGYFTPDEWRAIQPFVVSLAYPTSERTRKFLGETDSELVFKDGDELRGLRRMKLKLPKLYDDGPNGYGLDIEADAFRNLSIYFG